MTTHLRARVLQAGAFLALIGGVLVAVPSAASAASPTVTIVGAPGSVSPGGKAVITYRIAVPNGDSTDDVGVEVAINATGAQSCDKCDGGTTPIKPGSSATFTLTLTAPDVAAGQKKTMGIQVAATIPANGADPGGSGNASKTITVNGPDKPQTVSQVSGRVKDEEGKAVSGALVGLRDSQNNQYQTTTNGDGGYSFRSTDSKPIAVGVLAVGATKDGYILASQTAQGSAGRSVNVPLTLKLKNPASASPSPSPSISATTPTTEPAADDTTDPATENSAVALDAAPKAGTDKDSNSTLYLVLGGLLVAAGIGAIVLVLMRRKSNEDAEENGAAAPGGAVPAAAPAGGYAGADQTRLAAPVGAGRGGDATMIAPRSGAPSMADAPTMIHQAAPPVDEFPDPYGAPVPPGGGYNAPGGWGTAGAAGGAGAAGAYGAAQGAPAYGATNQYGGAPVPAQHGGYAEQDDHGYAGNGYVAPQAAGYPEQAGYDQGGYEQPAQTYDEPTGMYRPEPNGGYPQEAGYVDQAGYGAAEPVYGQNEAYAQGADDYADQAHTAPYQDGNGYQGAAYGAPAEPAWGGAGGGIDSGNAYGPPAGGGTYGGPAQGGGTYGGAPAYGAPAGTYGAPAGGGYVDPAGAPGNGYGDDQAGYDPRAVYGHPEGYDQPGPGQQPPQGGYGDQGGYAGGADQNGYYGGQPHQQQPPPPQNGGHPGQRRPNEWIED